MSLLTPHASSSHVNFLPHPCYQSSAVFISRPSFSCHLFTSTIIPSPPVPSFASCSFCLPTGAGVCVFPCDRLILTLLVLMEGRWCFLEQGKQGGDGQHSRCGKLTACASNQSSPELPSTVSRTKPPRAAFDVFTTPLSSPLLTVVILDSMTMDQPWRIICTNVDNYLEYMFKLCYIDKTYKTFKTPSLGYHIVLLWSHLHLPSLLLIRFIIHTINRSKNICTVASNWAKLKSVIF